MDYSQPDFYRFSQDSTELVNYVREHVHQNIVSILDVGTGCGLLGIEAANHFSNLELLVLLEPQKEFNQYIQHNLENFLKTHCSVQIRNTILSKYETNQKFDLIVCNPPYFSKGHGRVSPNVHKQACRTFSWDDPESYMKRIVSLLEDDGQLYILIPLEVEQRQQVVQKYSGKLSLKKELSGVGIYSYAK